MGAPISLDGWQSIRIIGALPGTTLLIYPGYPVAWLWKEKLKPLLHFSKTLVNSNFDLETNYITRKPTNRCFQRYTVWTEILSNFSHERNTFLRQRRNGKSNTNKPTLKPPLVIGGCGVWTPSNTPMPGPTLLITPKGTSITSLHAPLHNYATKSPLFTMGCPTSTSKLPSLQDNCQSQLTASSLDPADPTSQTASRSNQPDKQTNRLTDNGTHYITCTNTRLC